MFKISNKNLSWLRSLYLKIKKNNIYFKGNLTYILNCQNETFFSPLHNPIDWPRQPNLYEFIRCLDFSRTGTFPSEARPTEGLPGCNAHCSRTPKRTPGAGKHQLLPQLSAAQLLPVFGLTAARPRMLLASCLNIPLTSVNICQVLIMLDSLLQILTLSPPSLKMPDFSWSLFRGSKMKAFLIRDESSVIPSPPVPGAKMNSANKESHLD